MPRRTAPAAGHMNFELPAQVCRQSCFGGNHAFGQILEGLPADQTADCGKRVNGKAARASYEVKVGDQITMRFGARTVTVEVLSVQETVRQADAGALYREI